MDKKYNVLLIMTDQLRSDVLGCYGNDIVETVNIDYLASMGTVFDCAYTPSPSCIPARASLMTGMDNWNTGILGMGWGQGGMGVNFKHTLPGELAKAGYHTQGVGKMHFAPQRALLGFHNTVLDESGRSETPEFVSDYRQWFMGKSDGGYDIIDHGIHWNSWMARPSMMPEYLHATFWTISQSIKFLEERDPSKPFFLKTSFARPHSPYDSPQWYFDLYEKKGVKKPWIGDWADIHDVKEDAADPCAWRGVRKDEEIDRARAGYYGSVHFIDHQIGRLLQHMIKNRLLNDTLIIFTSDHGDMLGDHNLWRKTYAYEGSAHIPFIVVLPKDERNNSNNKKCTKPVTLQDVMPTILNFLEIDIPDTVDGLSVIPLIVNEEVIWRDYVHGEHCTCYSTEQEMQYLTDGKIKYIWFPRLDTEQLFDITTDPGEIYNLFDDPKWQDTLKLWRSRMIKIMEDRDCGAAADGRLVSQIGKPPFVSPNYAVRTGTNSR